MMRSTALDCLYRSSLALLTDFYELTMAQGYWRCGRQDDEAVFHLQYRSNPFDGGYVVACGLEYVLQFIERFRFASEDLAFLGSLEGSDGEPVFVPEFLDYLGGLRLRVDVDAMPEGTVAFPLEPLLRVEGGLVEAQILESAVLNCINFQSLIATKATRVCEAAGGDSVLEFGLRRAQGMDGALAASRAAYVGGCAGSSNVLAGRFFGIPVKGTHAHSWVMVFEDELEAFEAYADALPNNCIFLVDTFDTLQGVRHACLVGRRLRAKGHALTAIRLDSGDLAYLSQEARKILDGAGFADVKIVASGNLDEHVIQSLKEQKAAIDLWGVGTDLIVGRPDAALDGVYKVSAWRKPGGPWRQTMKISEQVSKISLPGRLQVRRYWEDARCVGDCIHDVDEAPSGAVMVVDPVDSTRRKRLDAEWEQEDLLVPVVREGAVVYDCPSLDAIRMRVRRQLDGLHPGIRRFLHPHQYPVGLAEDLHERRMNLINGLREAATVRKPT